MVITKLTLTAIRLLEENGKAGFSLDCRMKEEYSEEHNYTVCDSPFNGNISNGVPLYQAETLALQREELAELGKILTKATLDFMSERREKKENQCERNISS